MHQGLPVAFAAFCLHPPVAVPTVRGFPGQPSYREGLVTSASAMAGFLFVFIYFREGADVWEVRLTEQRVWGNKERNRRLLKVRSSKPTAHTLIISDQFEIAVIKCGVAGARGRSMLLSLWIYRFLPSRR